jgi:hypothetical protein
MVLFSNAMSLSIESYKSVVKQLELVIDSEVGLGVGRGVGRGVGLGVGLCFFVER